MLESFKNYCGSRGLIVETAASDAAAAHLKKMGFTGGLSRRPAPVQTPVQAPEPEPETYPLAPPVSPKKPREPRDTSFYGKAISSQRKSGKGEPYQPDSEETARILELGREGNTPLGITTIMGDETGKLIPVHVIRDLLKANKVSPGADPMSKFDKPDIKDMVRNPFPLPARVRSHSPKKGEFGFGKNTKDIFADRIASAESGKGSYKFSPEMASVVNDLHGQGYQPLAISLELADRFGKRVPVGAISKFVGNQ